MVRKYIVTVNGKSYDVDVEEKGSGMVSSAAPVPAAPIEAMAPAAPMPAAASAATPAAAGSGSVVAPMPGKILKILVSAGSTVTKGQVVLILEAMKMENEIFAHIDGSVAQICTKEGDSVNTDDTLLVIG